MLKKGGHSSMQHSLNTEERDTLEVKKKGEVAKNWAAVVVGQSSQQRPCSALLCLRNGLAISALHIPPPFSSSSSLCNNVIAVRDGCVRKFRNASGRFVL